MSTSSSTVRSSVTLRAIQGFITSHLTFPRFTLRLSSGGYFTVDFFTLTPLTMPLRLKG